MKHFVLALTFGLSLILSSCNQSDPTSSNTSTGLQPGSLQLIQGLSVASSSVTRDSSYSYVFNLDTAEGSKQVFFILQNNGDYDITNVQLKTNNPQFYFSPSTIPVLHSSKASTVVQVIGLNIIHGTRLDGIGYDSVLSMGNNNVTVQISATTTDIHQDSINISQTAQLKVFAKLFDMNVYLGDSISSLTLANLFSPTQVDCAGFQGMPAFTTNTTQIKIVNSGNVAFKVGWIPENLGTFGNQVITDTQEVMPDSSSYRTITPNMTIVINAGGVTSNQFKLPIAPNGNTYLCLEQQGAP